MTLAHSYFPKRLTKLLLTLAIFISTGQCVPSNEGPPLPASPAGPTLRIALLSPTSGEQGTFGRMMLNGVLLAFDQWNATGGVLNRAITWQIYDTPCEFKIAQQAAQQAVTAGFEYIIGPLCSEAALGAALVAEANQVLLITPTAMHPLVTVNGQGQTRATVFRASYVFAWQGIAAARFARNTLKVDKAAILTRPGDDYAIAVTAAFSQTFVAGGGKIVEQTPYPTNPANFSDTLSAINQQGADLIYLPAPPLVVNTIAGQLNALKATPSFKDITLLGSDRWESASLNREVTSGSYFTAHFWVAEDDITAKMWAEAYQASYAIAPDTSAALGYDAANLLLSAIKKAETFEPMTVTKALETGQFASITGLITFDAQHNPRKPVPILHINPQGIDLSAIILP